MHAIVSYVGKCLLASFGYAAYYFVRANFDLAQKGLIEAGMYNKAELGIIGTGRVWHTAYLNSLWHPFPIAQTQKSLPFGLLLSGLCMTMMGLMPWATSGIAVMFIMIFLNGWFQGMGWPPCGRTMVHWWSKSERGSIVSIWNTAHNLGEWYQGRWCYSPVPFTSAHIVLKRPQKTFGNKLFIIQVLQP